MKMNNKQPGFTLGELLEIITNKGAAWQSTYRINYHMSKLKGLIQEPDYRDLSIALGHYRLGQGAAEFYDFCKYLKEKYLK